MNIPTIRIIQASLVLAAAAGVAGCAPPVVSNYASISTHTLQVAPDKQADVVWVQQYKDGNFVLLRCFNSPDGPSCVHVKTP